MAVAIRWVQGSCLFWTKISKTEQLLTDPKKVLFPHDLTLKIYLEILSYHKMATALDGMIWLVHRPVDDSDKHLNLSFCIHFKIIDLHERFVLFVFVILQVQIGFRTRISYEFSSQVFQMYLIVVVTRFWLDPSFVSTITDK